jgi:hypothetical protein
MIALVALIAVVVWTLLVVRILGLGATLSERTFGIYLVLGALLAMAVAPPLASLVSPYAQPPSGLTLLLITIGRLALVLAPVAYALHSEATYRATSVADAFLLAFMVGFGFDLFGALVAIGAATQPLSGLSFLPPWQIATDRQMVAGFGYWAGLVALVAAASRRFIPQVGVAQVVTALVFLLVCLQVTAVSTTDRPSGSLAALLGVVFDRVPTAWVVLLALVALSVWEAIWVARATSAESPGGAGRGLLPMAEWRARFGALAHGNVGEYAEASAFFARLRQERLAHAEAARQTASPTPPPAPPTVPPPAPPTVPSTSPTMPPPRTTVPRPTIPAPPGGRPVRQSRPDSPDDDRPTPPPTPRPIMGGSLDVVEGAAESRPPARTPRWRSPGVIQLTLAIALGVVVLVLPRLPLGVTRAVWAFPLLSFELQKPALTILNALLVLVLLAWYVLAAGRPGSADIDERVRFAGEQAILQAGLASAVLVLLGVRNNFLYPFYSLVALHAGGRFPQLEVAQAQTVLLLLATAAASLTLGRTLRWRRAPHAERRASAVHNAITVLTVLLVSWVIVAFYLPTLASFHSNFGQFLFSLFGQAGNTFGGYLMIAFSALLSWLTLMVIRPLAARVEQFLVADADEELA